MSSLPAAIVYDARSCRPGMTGVGRYSLNLLRALASAPDRPPIRALFNPEGLRAARADAALEGVAKIAAPWSHESHPMGDVWLRFGAPRLMRPGELYHGPAFIVPGGAQRFARVATIHDPIVFTHPGTFPARFGWFLRRAIRAAAARADLIVTPTEAVAAELIELGLAPRRRIRAIHEAPDATPALWEAPAGVQDFHDPPGDRPLILTIGGPEPRKDPETAMRAAVALEEFCSREGLGPFAWWWAGRGAGGLERSELFERAAGAGFRFVGHTPAAALARWMERASALVSTSLAEGFNLTLVQAMAAGRPVVVSDIAPHREVCAGAAEFFARGDAGGLAAALGRLLGDEEEWRAQSRAAAARGADFSWEAAARQTLDVYRECAAKQKRD